MKKHFIIPIAFLFLGCSIIAKPVENGDLISSVWCGYYNSNEVPDFNNNSFSQFKIDKNFISIKSGNYSIETGKPIQSIAGSYKITKTLQSTPEEFQVFIVDALTDDSVERVLRLKKKNENIYISEPKLWEIGMDINALNYKEYLYSETYVDLSAVDPVILDPSEVVLFDTFLEKMTGGKDVETWELSPIAGKMGGPALGIIGMSVGSKVTIYKECVKNLDGTPKIDKNGQRIWGYAHGKTIEKPHNAHDYAIYYTPIPEDEEEDIENKYGIYWFQGNWLFKNRRIEIPVMVHESKGINRAYSGVVNGLLSTKPWDSYFHWDYLDKYSLDAIMEANNFINRTTPIQQ